jgi:glycerol-3-phosphate O-acyltransferase/dihydroxyacetone phosphate acyltransferase
MRSAANLAMAGLARILIRIFFRDVHVENGERLESGRPTVLVANHRNGLVDGLLLMAALGRYPRFLGKATLFRIPALWPFLKLGGVVPIHRAQDGVSTARNTDAFAVSNRLLARGGMVAVFPEGISHDEPGLQPLRTGAARIALGGSAAGLDDVETVAVGLIYDAKQRFRSRALVRVGVPEPVSRWMDEYRVDDHGAVRSLTDDLAARLRCLVPDYSSWAEADALADIAEIVARQETTLPRDVGLARRQQLAEALTHAETLPGLVGPMGALRQAHDTYGRHLALLGFSDAQVMASYRSGRLRRALLWSLAKVIGAAPFAAVGAMVHVAPYELVRRLSRIPRNEGMRATVKLLGCFFSFTAVYAALGVILGLAFGPAVGLLAALGAPACGYLTIRMIERVRRMGGALEGLRLARHRGPQRTSLLADRSAVVAAAGVALGWRTGGA